MCRGCWACADRWGTIDQHHLHGIDHLADNRAQHLPRVAMLAIGDAEALNVADARFDTVICAFPPYAIPDHRRAVAEMARTSSAPTPAHRGTRRTLEHFRRRPHELVETAGVTVFQHNRFLADLAEPPTAVKP